MFIQLIALRLSFHASRTLHFPRGKAANTLRGSFGYALRAAVCPPECPGARLCPGRADCLYAKVFEPASLGPGPSGLIDRPRPFVFRARHLDGITIPAGGSFDFDIHLFDLSDRLRADVTRAFSQLDWAHLHSATETPVAVDLSPPIEDTSQIRVQFLTPTELKTGNTVAALPEFPVLFARIRDRVSTLRALYGPGPLEIDFKAMGRQASEILMTASELKNHHVNRRSSRTGQVHAVGGFTGWVDYRGPLRPFISYLHAARWTGVGRHCVWGNGEISLPNSPFTPP